MKVCLVTGEFPPAVGGLADYTRHLARGLVREGVEAIVLTSSSPRRQGRTERETGLSPEALAAEEGLRVWRGIERWDFRIFRRVRQAMDDLRPDLVHIQYQTAAFGMHPAVNLLPRWLRWRRPWTPLVATVHDLREPYLFPKAGPLRHWVRRELLANSRGIIATNPDDFIATRALTAGVAPRPRITLVPIGPNVFPQDGLGRWRSGPQGCRRQALARWGAGAGEYLLGHFGLLNQTKGLETLLHALRILRDGGVPATLVMLGEEAGASDPTNRPQRDRLRDQARILGLEQRLVWTGYLPPDELSRALLALDCCVLPYADGASYRRGTLLAALAHGLPVVTTRPQRRAAGVSPGDGALPALRDREHCLLVEPGDARRLAAAIQELLADETLRTRLGAAAARLAEAFSWESIARRTADFYREVLESSAPRPGERS